MRGFRTQTFRMLDEGKEPYKAGSDKKYWNRLICLIIIFRMRGAARHPSACGATVRTMHRPKPARAVAGRWAGRPGHGVRGLAPFGRKRPREEGPADPAGPPEPLRGASPLLELSPFVEVVQNVFPGILELHRREDVVHQIRGILRLRRMAEPAIVAVAGHHAHLHE